MVLDKALKVVALTMIVISSLAIVSYSSQAMGLTTQLMPRAKVTSNVISNNSENGETNVANVFNEEKVSSHNIETDCWMIIDGGVYDATSYISGHPGGSSMVAYCGKDATAIFASIHTQTGYNVLAGYQIGVIGTPASACTPNWSTGAWSSCVNGNQTRTVTDLNSCGNVAGKPSTTQTCTTLQTNSTNNHTREDDD